MSGYMFHDEMVKRMMKSTVNPDAQILETAYETGRKQGQMENIKAVLEIVDEENNLSKLAEETPWGYMSRVTLAKNIKNRVLALKGEQGIDDSRH